MCGYFGTKKKSGSNRCSPLNSSVDKNKTNKKTVKIETINIRLRFWVGTNAIPKSLHSDSGLGRVA